MVKLTFVEASGEAHDVEVDGNAGYTVMEAAVKNGVPGIAADCGGACACATCRVYIPEEWRARTGEAAEGELEMIEFADETDPRARLSCQIKVTDELDGIVVDLPASQH